MKTRSKLCKILGMEKTYMSRLASSTAPDAAPQWTRARATRRAPESGSWEGCCHRCCHSSPSRRTTRSYNQSYCHERLPLAVVHRCLHHRPCCRPLRSRPAFHDDRHHCLHCLPHRAPTTSSWLCSLPSSSPSSSRCLTARRSCLPTRSPALLASLRSCSTAGSTASLRRPTAIWRGSLLQIRMISLR